MIKRTYPAEPSRVMQRVRAYTRKSGRAGEEGLPPAEGTKINPTSLAPLGDFGEFLSPMVLCATLEGVELSPRVTG